MIPEGFAGFTRAGAAEGAKGCWGLWWDFVRHVIETRTRTPPPNSCCHWEFRGNSGTLGYRYRQTNLPVGDESYQYDDSGNRETANGASYTAGDHNRLESVHDGVTVTRFVYDGEGNRILKYTDVDESGTFSEGDTDVDRVHLGPPQAECRASLAWAG